MYIAYPLAISQNVADKILRKHRITIDDVEASIRTRDQYVRKGRGKNIYEVLTRAPSGLYLRVVLRNTGGANYKLITALPMTDTERKYYATKKQ